MSLDTVSQPPPSSSYLINPVTSRLSAAATTTTIPSTTQTDSDATTSNSSTHTHHSSHHHTLPTHILTPQAPTPSPTITPPPDIHLRPHSTQSPIAIVFEVLGGLAGFAFVLGFIRCLHSYRKTPNRDRVAAFVNRHRLEREMEELEQNNAFHHSYRFNPPPPPYFPKPPSYEGMNPFSDAR
jgi:hypothetical protein